jgi:hypothetical protein
MKRILLIIACLFPFALSAEESPFKQQLDQLWKDGKITPEQPFQAEVVAAGGLSPWSGQIVIYLREKAENGRVLQVVIGVFVKGGIEYVEITQKEFDAVLEWRADSRGYNACVYVTPVDVSNFVWVTPLGDVGKKLGDSEIVRQVYLKSLQEK